MTTTKIDELVRVALSDLINHDIDWLNDYVSEQITGSRVALEDIGFKAEAIDNDEIILRVSAVVADID